MECVAMKQNGMYLQKWNVSDHFILCNYFLPKDAFCSVSRQQKVKSSLFCGKEVLSVVTKPLHVVKYLLHNLVAFV